MSNIDKIASGHIKQLLVKVLAPIIKNLKNPPEHVEEYKAEYGYLGPALQAAVTKPPPISTSTSNVNSNTITNMGVNIARSVTGSSGLVQQVHFMITHSLVEFKVYFIEYQF